MKVVNLRSAVGRTIAAATIAAAACSEPKIGTPGPEDFHSSESDKVLITVPALSSPSVGTRIEMTDDTDTPSAGQSVSLSWTEGDAFALWAVGDNADESCKNIRFEYWGTPEYDEQSVCFVSGEVPKMAEGTYSYTAFYPVPSEENIDRELNKVSYEIPASQSGSEIYDGSLDIMTARPARSRALLRDWYSNDLALKFEHRTHTLKVTVPAEKNSFGQPISRIRIEFPQPVAGRITFDAATGEADTGGLTENYVDVRFDDPVPTDEEFTFWVFIAPVSIDGGTVKFTAYGTGEGDKEYKCDPSSTTRFGDLQEAHITPVKLGIDEGYSVTWFNYTVDGLSQLGEDVTALHLTLPEGLRFADRTAETTLYPDPEDGLFKVAFRTRILERWFSEGNASVTMTPIYESEHALVAEHAEPLIIASGGYEYDTHNDMGTVAAPYLFFEDFAAVESLNYVYDHSSSGRTGEKAAHFFMGSSGWTGARIKSQANTSISVACYRNRSIVSSESTNAGRVDSAPIKQLKESASVNIVLQFRYSMNQANTLGSDIAMTCYVGRVENPEALNSASTEGSFYDEFKMNEKTGSFTNLLYDYNHIIESCSNASRLSWRIVPDAGSNNSNNTCWLFIDDIRVSIANN